MSKQIPLKINGFAETRDSPHCDLFEDISRVSGLSPTHFGKRGGKSGFSHQNLTLAYRSGIGRAIQ